MGIAFTKRQIVLSKNSLLPSCKERTVFGSVGCSSAHSVADVRGLSSWPRAWEQRVTSTAQKVVLHLSVRLKNMFGPGSSASGAKQCRSKAVLQPQKHDGIQSSTKQARQSCKITRLLCIRALMMHPSCKRWPSALNPRRWTQASV